MLCGRIEDPPHVVARLAQIRKEWAEVVQLGIVGVIEPRRDGDRVVRMEDVGRGRIVNDDGVLDRTAELREVLCNLSAY